jgi:hypothetical protein
MRCDFIAVSLVGRIEQSAAELDIDVRLRRLQCIAPPNLRSIVGTVATDFGLWHASQDPETSPSPASESSCKLHV